VAVRDRITRWAHIAREANQGQGLVEYALLLVFIAVVAVVAVTSLGNGVYSLFSRASFSF
jgi:Flp pilus assembly pilin Flp